KSTSYSSVHAHLIEIPLPTYLTAHLEELPPLEELHVLGKRRIHRCLLRGKATELEYLSQQLIVQLDVGFHDVSVYRRTRPSGHMIPDTMYTTSASLGPQATGAHAETGACAARRESIPGQAVAPRASHLRGSPAVLKIYRLAARSVPIVSRDIPAPRFAGLDSPLGRSAGRELKPLRRFVCT